MNGLILSKKKKGGVEGESEVLISRNTPYIMGPR